MKEHFNLFVYYPKLQTIIQNNNINQNDDVIISQYYTLERKFLEEYIINKESSRAQYETPLSSHIFLDYRGDPIDPKKAWSLNQVNKKDYEYKVEASYVTKNFYNSEYISLEKYNRTKNVYEGGEGNDALILSSGNDFLALDDSSSGATSQARIRNIESIFAGDGNDLINLSSTKYLYQDILVDGNEGNDKIWSSIGNDKIFGGDGDDEIFSGDGNDIISGDNGNDSLFGGKGGDVYKYNIGNGFDIITEENVDDVDQIKFNIGIDPTKIFLTKFGNDLVIKISENDQITIKNQFAANAASIENLTFANETFINLSKINLRENNIIFLIENDAKKIDDPLTPVSKVNIAEISLSAKNGVVQFKNQKLDYIFDFEDIIYIPNKDFFGVDEIL